MRSLAVVLLPILELACGAGVKATPDHDGGHSTPNDAGERDAASDARPDADEDAGIDVIEDFYLSDADAVCVDSVRPREPPECWAQPLRAGVALSDLVPLPRPGRAVALHGERAYVIDVDGRLTVLRVPDDTSALPHGSVELPGEPQDVRIGGRWAWVAAGSVGLLGVDVFDGNAPALVSQLALPGEARAVATTCTHAFVASGSGGLQIVDISLPEAPLEAGSLALDGDAISVWSDGELVLVGTTNLLAVVDATSFDAPFLRSTFHEGSMVTSVASAASRLFLGLEDPPGLLIADFSDPDRPLESHFELEYGAVVSLDVGPHVLAWTALGDYQFGLADWCDSKEFWGSATVVRGQCGPDCEPVVWQSVDVAIDVDRAVAVYDDASFGLQFATACCF